MNWLTYQKVREYCAALSEPQDPLLTKLERETHLSTIAPQMIAGRWQGALLGMLSRLVSPECILEVGTFTGYSTICLARGLRSNGTMDTIEADPEREAIIRDYLRQAELESQVTLHIGDAMDILPSLDKTYQLIFIDAGKRDYKAYYARSKDLLDAGGLLMLDNTLWGGKVIADPEDADARLIHTLNTEIQNDQAVRSVILPMRDGLTLVQKL